VPYGGTVNGGRSVVLRVLPITCRHCDGVRCLVLITKLLTMQFYRRDCYIQMFFGGSFFLQHFLCRSGVRDASQTLKSERKIQL
jgi:hypothetical protein